MKIWKISWEPFWELPAKWHSQFSPFPLKLGSLKTHKPQLPPHRGCEQIIQTKNKQQIRLKQIKDCWKQDSWNHLMRRSINPKAKHCRIWKNLPAKISRPKAVFLVSKAPIRPPGIVNAGADKSRDFPSVSKNWKI